MVILPWIIKFIKKNWKKIIVVIVSLIVFYNILVIGINLYIRGYIPVKKIGTVETYEGYVMREYDAHTREKFLAELETWKENGYSPEDIDALREKLLEYEDNVLIIYFNCPIKYLYFYRDDSRERVYGSYEYEKGESCTKIYVYITEYQDKIFQSPFLINGP